MSLESIREFEINDRDKNNEGDRQRREKGEEGDRKRRDEEAEILETDNETEHYFSEFFSTASSRPTLGQRLRRRLGGWSGRFGPAAARVPSGSAWPRY